MQRNYKPANLAGKSYNNHGNNKHNNNNDNINIIYYKTIISK